MALKRQKQRAGYNRILEQARRSTQTLSTIAVIATPCAFAQSAKPRPTWWAPSGFAAIPTAALDPPHSAASPAVPALIGSGSPSVLAVLAIPPLAAG